MASAPLSRDDDGLLRPLGGHGLRNSPGSAGGGYDECTRALLGSETGDRRREERLGGGGRRGGSHRR